jgi:hypothetical protein
MENRVGLSAGLLALLAVFLHTQFQPGMESVTPVRTAAPSAASEDSKKPSTAKSDGYAPPEGPWLATQAYFHVPAELNRPEKETPEYTKVLPELLKPDGKPGEEKLRVVLGAPNGLPEPARAIVVTLPDPLRTRLSLASDNQIASLEWSLQEAGWQFAEQWLPWSDGAAADSGAINARRKERLLEREQRDFPGILIFDRPLEKDKLLFVLVVPETTTAGIHGPAFFAALHLAHALSGQKVGLLAPTFSGSFRSLFELIREWQHGERTKPPELFGTVYSGSAVNSEYAQVFTNETGLSFHSGRVNAADFSKVACTILKEQRMNDHAVMLREGESGLSAGIKDARGEDCFRNYVFPRDISHLRNAYQEAASGSVRDPYNAGPNLTFSIRDPNSGGDSIPTFSATQTPLTQDAILASIAQEFADGETRIVMIEASNVLDTLFLMRAIRRESPNTRFLIENPNVLLTAATAREGFGGTILLSTYPMFAEGEKWLDGEAGDKLRFADPSSQGLFNVTQLLLNDLGLIGHPPQLRAYRGFGDNGPAYPGMWVLTLNRSGFAPLDLKQDQWTKLDCKECPAPKSDWMKPGPDGKKSRRSLPVDFDPPQSWRTTIVAVNGAILLGILWILWATAGKRVRPLWPALTADPPRLQALLGASLLLIAGEALLASPLPHALKSLKTPERLPQIITGLGMAGAAALALAALGTVLAHMRTKPREWRAGSLFAVATAATFGWILWNAYQFGLRTGPSGFFARYRAADLYSGSSPAAPLLLVAVFCLSVSILYLKRYHLATGRPPLLEFRAGVEDSKEAKAFLKEMHEATAAIGIQAMAPLNLDRRATLKLALWGAGLVVFAFLIPGSASWSAFERPEFNSALTAGVLLCLFWLAIGCVDLWRLWERLKRVLRLFEYLPLDHVLERVSREWPKRPIWEFGVAVSTERITRQMLYALLGRRTVLANAPPQVVAAVAGGGDRIFSRIFDVEAARERADRHLHGFSSAIDPQVKAAHREQNLEKQAGGIAAAIMRDDLRPFWRKFGADETNGSAQESPQEQFTRFGGEFVALQFCRYMVHWVRAVRWTAVSVSVSFVLVILLFNSYSPQSPQTVARFLALVFLGVGYLVTRVFAQMERDAFLSRIAGSKPGELNTQFWVQMAALGGLPLLGVVARLFPAVSQFLFQWIAPGVQAMH